MKLELKHITPYLPYELKIFEPLQSKGLILDLKMTTYNSERIGLPFLFEHGFYKIQYGLPILRPLSDLTKDEFEELYDSMSYNTKMLILRDDNLHYNWAESTPYFDFKKLLENHFDVFGLIEKGLAIDVNTLN